MSPSSIEDGHEGKIMASTGSLSRRTTRARALLLSAERVIRGELPRVRDIRAVEEVGGIADSARTVKWRYYANN